MEFLYELLNPDGLSRVKLPNIDDFIIGFTHFISINHKPNKETIEAIWERRGAIHFKRNQQGADLGLIIKHHTTSQFGAIIFHVKNWANPPSRTQEQATGPSLRAKVIFDEDCAASIEANYLGVYLHVGNAYTETAVNIEAKYYDNTAQRKILQRSVTRYNSNGLIVHGLGSFNLSDEYRTVFKNLICAWNDPLTVCAQDETELLCQMLPCVYGPPKK
ncbi:hypothetical protein G9A89_000581, partial [Geosiphon pyriformis]